MKYGFVRIYLIYNVCMYVCMYVVIREAAEESQRKAAAKSGKSAEVRLPAPIVSIVFPRYLCMYCMYALYVCIVCIVCTFVNMNPLGYMKYVCMYVDPLSK